MEATIQELLSEVCKRPQHLRVDRWFVPQAGGLGLGLWNVYEAKRRETRRLRPTASRRLVKWWRSPPVSAALQTVYNEKLVEAKMQRFTAEGKRERVARSLAALNQQPAIRLTPEEWRQIVEDPDLEDQFS